ncbi:hypothetical protein FRZ06_02910 [Anoxybacterium hadale]|uniref:Uncharacterized protein n=1 Tax=Anoxybacterium hadale TaxID=3408580 RepID=A0ACD1A7X5_9FIRM|nr:hypothetical protein FRZ06_02910 [Clostridiales bacterium]
MGTWGVGIKANDDFMDFYDDIIEQFNDGKPFDEITKAMLHKYESEYKEEIDQLHNLFFALAYSGWECGYRDAIIFEKVKNIIEDGTNIEVWRELGASSSTLTKREKALSDFLKRIEVKKKNPKKAKIIKFKPAIFDKGTVLVINLDNGTYSGAIVLESENEDKEYGSNLILEAFINKKTKPTIQEILKAKVYDYSWYSSHGYKKYSSRFEIIGNLNVEQNYSCCRGTGSTYSSWINLVSNLQDNYYRYKENNRFKKVKKFLNLKSIEIEKIQRERVINEMKALLKQKSNSSKTT